MTQQELGLHLIARYLLTPYIHLPNVPHMVEKLRGAYGIPNIFNVSDYQCGAYMWWPITICGGCKTISTRGNYELCRPRCSCCIGRLDSISYNSVIGSEQLNWDIARIDPEYKLKLVEILWQTQLRRLL